MTERDRINDLSNIIIGCGIEVHKILGPGLLESAYEECLCRELSLAGLKFERDIYTPIRFYRSLRSLRLCGEKLDGGKVCICLLI